MRPNQRDAEAGRAEAEGGVEAGAQALPAEAVIAGLRANGAQHIDPLRFGLIEAMARRASGRSGALAQRLQRRLGDLLQAYGAQVDRAYAEADQLAADLQRRYPQAVGQIQRCRADADANRLSGPSGLSGLRRLAQQLAAQAAPAPLAELLARLQPSALTAATAETSDHADASASAIVGASAAPPGPPAELKALSQFRQGWARLDVAQQLQRSKRQAPENAGPLHSQGLVLRALQQLQAISPDYLDGLVSQFETMIWLDQVETVALPAAAGPGRRESGKPPRQTVRRKTGGTSGTG